MTVHREVDEYNRRYNRTLNMSRYNVFSRDVSIAQVVHRGLPFHVGHWLPVTYDEPKLRVRWLWGPRWREL